MLPRLVQRVHYREAPQYKGLDAFFEFDYMGSAEFEWGCLPKATAIMREEKTAAWKVTPLEITASVTPARTAKFTAFFIGHPDDVKVAEELLKDQLKSSPTHETKERTHMRRSFLFHHPDKSVVAILMAEAADAVHLKGKAPRPEQLEWLRLTICDAWWIVDGGWARSFRDQGIGFGGSEQRPFVIFREKAHAERWLALLEQK